MSVHDMPELEDYCNVFEGRGNPKSLENKLLIFRLLNLSFFNKKKEVL